MGPTGSCYRVLQIHPTRHCNLSCAHCYSLSGPKERVSLDADLLLGAIGDAAEEGYNVAGFSGGEPVLYEPLGSLLERAKSLGMITTVTSNGMLLDQRRLDMLNGVTDLIAISVDGVPEAHDEMRGSAGAFDTMVERLDDVRASGIPFGFIFTLTQYNLNELEWVTNFALEQGAGLLQIHPLEDAGRAVEMLEEHVPDATEAAYAFLVAAEIEEKVGDRLQVQLDLVDRDLLREFPERVFAANDPADIAPSTLASRPLGELITPLIVEADGTVAPVQYGFDRRYVLGNLADARLSELATRWRRERLPAFRALCQQVYERIVGPKSADSDGDEADGDETDRTGDEAELPFFNWYEEIARQARQAEPLVPLKIAGR